ncbi:MAG: hypothetical protein ABJF74_08400, partial [Sedimentitalea sp.]
MSITHILTNFISQYGLAALFVTLTLGSLGAPAPGESAILVTASSSCGTSQKPVRGRMTKPKQSGAFSGQRFPPEIIGYAVWAYHRFA